MTNNFVIAMTAIAGVTAYGSLIPVQCTPGQSIGWDSSRLQMIADSQQTVDVYGLLSVCGGWLSGDSGVTANGTDVPVVANLEKFALI